MVTQKSASRKRRLLVPVAAALLLIVAGWALAVIDGVGTPKEIAPKTIYAVPGLEVSVYFENLGFVADTDKIWASTKFTGSFGKLERRRWVGTPAESDIGEHTLWVEVAVYDENNPDWYMKGDTRIYEIKIVVEPAVEKKGEQLRVLMVGDSITRQMFWPNALVRHLREKSGLEISTIGQVEWEEGSGMAVGRIAVGSGENQSLQLTSGFETDLSNYREASDRGVRAEAYNGWTTNSFLQRYFEHHPTVNPESDVSRSPFWWPEAMTDPNESVAEILTYESGSGGRPADAGELSFKRYLDVHADGTPPDVIIMMLGTNDAYFVGMGRLRGIKKIRSAASKFIGRVETMIELFREVNPNLPIFIVPPPPVAVSESAFHQNYKISSPAAGKIAKLSIQMHHEAMLKGLSGREAEGIYFIPAYVGMDPVDGYAPSQLVHPSPSGHQQLADQIYAFMAHWMRGETKE